MIPLNLKTYTIALIVIIVFNTSTLHEKLTSTVITNENVDETFVRHKEYKSRSDKNMIESYNQIHNRQYSVRESSNHTKISEKMSQHKKLTLTNYRSIQTNQSMKIDQNLITKLSRPFQSKPLTTWCRPDHTFNPSSPTGILYTRVPKTGSSTISGVLERISRIYGRKHPSIQKCSLTYRHLQKKWFKNRIMHQSYMIGSIRHPSKRAISRVFFQTVSKYGVEPTDQNIFEGLKVVDKQIGVVTRGQGGFQLVYLYIQGKIPRSSAYSLNTNGDKIINMTFVEEKLSWVMDNYHFIFLNERLDECLVLLQFLWDLKTNDIIYLSSKVSSGNSYYRWGNTTKSKCIKLQKSFVSPAIATYLKSPIWIQKNYADYMLHQIVNKSIDLTIDVMGKEKFKKALEQFRALKDRAAVQCASAPILPCSSSGQYQPESAENCYFEDIGCGYDCLDTVL